MPENREIAANEAARAQQTAGLESLLTKRGGTDLGGGRFLFEAPTVDKSESIAAKRKKIAENFLADAEARRIAALHTFGASGVHESTSPNLEAGFFTAQPMMNYAPPGTVEAGHRRFEDLDPQREEAYRKAWLNQQTAMRGTR